MARDWADKRNSTWTDGSRLEDGVPVAATGQRRECYKSTYRYLCGNKSVSEAAEPLPWPFGHVVGYQINDDKQTNKMWK